MTKKMTAGALAATLVAATMVPTLAQGRGRGFGGGAGWRGNGVCMGAGLGRGAGRGPGGWWTRVNPATPEQQAFVQQVTDLHNRIRALNLEIAGMRAANAPADQIAKKEQDVTALRSELARVTTANEKLLREMGIPAPYGVCNGQGPIGRYGGGAARVGGGQRWNGMVGAGLGPRNGTGPNPYCPLKK